jgi:hypothetical protein
VLPLQTCVAVQTLVQVPQCEWSEVVSTQAVPQSVSTPVQVVAVVHTPAEQS